MGVPVGAAALEPPVVAADVARPDGVVGAEPVLLLLHAASAAAAVANTAIVRTKLVFTCAPLNRPGNDGDVV
jgi:hypothetical protein